MNGEKIEPEWWRVATAEHVTGIGKAKLYELIAKGKIKTACLKDDQQAFGVRLIHVASLRAYIEAHAEGPK